MMTKISKRLKNGVACLQVSPAWADGCRAVQSSFRRDAATPSAIKKAANAESQLLMKAGMNGHGPIAYE